MASGNNIRHAQIFEASAPPGKIKPKRSAFSGVIAGPLTVECVAIEDAGYSNEVHLNGPECLPAVDVRNKTDTRRQTVW